MFYFCGLKTKLVQSQNFYDMEIPSKYDPKQVEDKWYSYWMAREFFKSVPDGRKPYTIVIPPPNVTGVLHMGHMLNNTIQDIMVRRARMQGKMHAGFRERIMLRLQRKQGLWQN